MAIQVSFVSFLKSKAFGIDRTAGKPFTCADSSSCTLSTFSSLWGCVNSTYGLKDQCFDADESEPLRGDVLNWQVAINTHWPFDIVVWSFQRERMANLAPLSPASAPYCNTLYLISSVITLSTWTCGTSDATLYLFKSYTSTQSVSTTLVSVSMHPSATTSSDGTLRQVPSSSSPAPPSNSPSPASSSSSPSTGAIVGAAIGGLAGIIAAFIAGYFVCWRGRLDRRMARERMDFDRINRAEQIPFEPISTTARSVR
jgi:hypothetical protein